MVQMLKILNTSLRTCIFSFKKKKETTYFIQKEQHPKGNRIVNRKQIGIYVIFALMLPCLMEQNNSHFYLTIIVFRLAASEIELDFFSCAVQRWPCTCHSPHTRKKEGEKKKQTKNRSEARNNLFFLYLPESKQNKIMEQTFIPKNLSPHYHFVVLSRFTFAGLKVKLTPSTCEVIIHN